MSLFSMPLQRGFIELPRAKFGRGWPCVRLQTPITGVTPDERSDIRDVSLLDELQHLNYREPETFGSRVLEERRAAR
jgi:hypothetical protein